MVSEKAGKPEAKDNMVQLPSGPTGNRKSPARRLKIMVVMGTRPEAIKLAPIIEAFRRRERRFDLEVCVTAQHRQMLDQVAELFGITPDYDLNIMSGHQDLFDITTRALRGLRRVLVQTSPDLVLVQGDTTTSLAAALASFYLHIPVGHVEAGLRTYDKGQPFPEEINRRLTTIAADFHFAPTAWAAGNLRRERVPANRIWVTGNPVIDALRKIKTGFVRRPERQALKDYFRERWDLNLSGSAGAGRTRIILVTGHRRENFGPGFREICLAIREIARRNPEVLLVYPVHLNPQVRKPVYDILGSGEPPLPNIRLIEPLDYRTFLYLMARSYLVLTDSGGVQEEAPSFGKPVLIMRHRTERPEGIRAGCAKLVGTDGTRIRTVVERLLHDDQAYARMAKVSNPYGDGKTAGRIVQIIDEQLRD
jgi:UDP-N-acetylglucosamine 2-epimerase (non-hydrolysing)